MSYNEPVRQFFQRCFSMKGLGTVVSGEEGPEQQSLVPGSVKETRKMGMSDAISEGSWSSWSRRVIFEGRVHLSPP